MISFSAAAETNPIERKVALWKKHHTFRIIVILGASHGSWKHHEYPLHHKAVWSLPLGRREPSHTMLVKKCHGKAIKCLMAQCFDLLKQSLFWQSRVVTAPVSPGWRGTITPSSHQGPDWILLYCIYSLLFTLKLKTILLPPCLCLDPRNAEYWNPSK